MKTIRMISIDADLNEASKIRRFKNPKFSLSDTINSYLRSFFEMEIKNLDRDKIQMEVAELEKKLALAKSKENLLENEEKRQEEQFTKKYGEEFIPET